MKLERLYQLYRHVIDEWPRGTIFNFNVFSVFLNDGCRTCGCLIGECPQIWPDDWCYSGWSGDPLLRADGQGSTIDDAMKWFELSSRDAYHLFIPNSQYAGSTSLSTGCSKSEAAENLLQFIHAKAQRWI